MFRSHSLFATTPKSHFSAQGFETAQIGLPNKLHKPKDKDTRLRSPARMWHREGLSGAAGSNGRSAEGAP